MKLLKYWFAVAFAATVLLASCKDDPEQPAPKFHFDNGLNEITVRRDTITNYTIRASIYIPNGAQRLLVIDGMSYEELETIELGGIKEYNLEYPMDFAQIDSDTTFAYLFKVVDLTGRMTNDSFVVNMIQSSHPVVQLAHPTWTTFYDAVPVRGEVSTGFNRIREIRVKQGATTLATIDGAELPDSSFTTFNVMTSQLAMGNNDIVIEVVDERDQTGSKTVKINRVAVPETRQKKIAWTYGLNSYSIEFTYDGQTPSAIKYSYGVPPNQTVENMIVYYNAKNGMPDSIRSATAAGLVYMVSAYTHDANGKLTETGYYYRNKTTNAKTAISVYAKDINFNEDKTPNNYLVGSTRIYTLYEPYFGGQVMCDYLASSISSATREKYVFLDKIPNPLYCPIFYQVARHMSVFDDGYYLPYFPEKRTTYVPPATPTTKAEYGAVVFDNKGRVKTFTKTLYAAQVQRHNYTITYLDE